MHINRNSIHGASTPALGILADSALGVLADAGAHLVLCRPNKRPLWRGWNKLGGVLVHWYWGFLLLLATIFSPRLVGEVAFFLGSLSGGSKSR